MAKSNFSNKAARPRKAPGEARDRPRQSATSYVLWLLSRRDYSAKDLQNKLLTRGYGEEEARQALAYAQECKYQDDVRYAKIKAESKAGKLGDRRIKQVLGEKGVDRETIEAQLAGMEPETERVFGAVSRFVGQALSPELRQKVFRFLAYRGFSGAAIKAALAHLSACAEAAAVEQ